jgi:D-3-phosphoglycerate dehydrogenase
MPLRVLLLEGIHPEAVMFFKKLGYVVKSLPKALPEDELIRELTAEGGVNILGIRSKTRLTERVLTEARSSLLTIGCFCIGTNQVDLAAANKLGIPVFNAPFANTRSVAELVIGEIIVMSRRLFDRSSEMHRGDWQKTASGCYEIRGKTLGIIGFGHIGAQLGVLGEMLGMSVVFYDVVPKLALGNCKALASMEDVFRQADFVTVHVPETPETKNLVRAEHFKLMKPSACFLNLSRGTVVDLEALALALREKRVAGAGVDVYPVEPEENGLGFVTPLQGIPNVILTPHVGGSTLEAQAAIGTEVGTSLHKFIQFGITVGAVNFPEISPSEKTAMHRIICIHRNEPGVLMAINTIVASAKANVRSQYLATDDGIGIVSLDMLYAETTELQAKMCLLDAHIKSRVCVPQSRAPSEIMLSSISTSDIEGVLDAATPALPPAGQK